MKIARMITVCAALITTFLFAETAHSNKRPVSRDQSPQQGRENRTNASEITFTTLRPVVPSFSHNTRSNVYQGKRLIRIRPSRSMAFRLRGSNLLNGSRRRRQLQYHGTKSSHVARSFDFGDNRVENQHIETLQPPEAFGKGAIHIEPIYRVTKNKNIFDSIIDIVRRIIDPRKSVGSLVGPFHFPGVGDKVYVRLLGQDRPDHVVIRLVSHLSPDEIDTSFHKNVPIAGEQVLSQSEMPSVPQTTIELPKEVLSDSHKNHDNVNVISSDNFLSASNNLGQVSKTTNVQIQQAKQKNDFSKGGHVSKTYESNVKHGDANESHGAVRHQNKNSVLGPITHNNNNVNSHMNRTQDHERYQDSFEQMYHFHSPMNDSSKENYASFDVDYQGFQYPRNISTQEEMFYRHPISPFDIFLHSPIPPAIDHSKNSSQESNASGPRYSIEFASKKMRYLNLDGSVEPAIKDDSTSNFEYAPSGFMDRQWKPITGITSKARGIAESSIDKKDRQIFQERSDNNGSDELVEIDWKSSEDLTNSQNVTSNTGTTKLGKRSSRCCLQQEDENQNAKLSSGEPLTNETTVNNSADDMKSTGSPVQLQRLQSSWGNTTDSKKV